MESNRNTPARPLRAGWLSRLIWRGHPPIAAFSVGKKIVVYQFENRDSPIVVDNLMGDGPMLSFSRVNAEIFANFLKITKIDSETQFEDRITIFRRGATFRLSRALIFPLPFLSEAEIFLKEDEAELLADVLANILADRA